MDRHRNVEQQGVFASGFKIQNCDQLLPAEEGVVRKEIAMDEANGKRRAQPIPKQSELLCEEREVLGQIGTGGFRQRGDGQLAIRILAAPINIMK